MLFTIVLCIVTMVLAAGASDSFENSSNSLSDEPMPSQDPQSRLFRDLFNLYDKRIRPVRNYNTPINVTLTMTLYQLVQVNEPEEYVVINIWMAMGWYDEFLAWDPEKFDNMTYLVVPWDHVWLSDIVLYNGLDMDHWSSEKRINIELTMEPSNPDKALVRFAFPAVYRFNCKMDIYYFPFDHQNCTLVFGSWVYDTRFVDVFPHAENVKMENFIPNQEWDVISFTSYRHALNYSCCPFPYSNVQYHFFIQRKPLFFVCNYVIPTLIVAVVSLIGFFMPGTTTGERTEKITLGISTCLAMSILLLMVSDRMPTAGNYVPMMAWFFLAIIVLVACAICLTTVVIIVQRRGRYGGKITPLLRRFFFTVVAKFLFVEVPPSFKTIRHGLQQMSTVMTELHAPLAKSESIHTGRSDGAAPGAWSRQPSIRVSRSNSPHHHVQGTLLTVPDPDSEGLGCKNNRALSVPAGSRRGSAVLSVPVDPVNGAPNIVLRRAGSRRGGGGSMRLQVGPPVEDILEHGVPSWYNPVTSEWEILADIVERVFLVVFLLALVALSTGTFYQAIVSMA